MVRDVGEPEKFRRLYKTDYCDLSATERTILDRLELEVNLMTMSPAGLRAYLRSRTSCCDCLPGLSPDEICGGLLRKGKHVTLRALKNASYCGRRAVVLDSSHSDAAKVAIGKGRVPIELLSSTTPGGD